MTRYKYSIYLYTKAPLFGYVTASTYGGRQFYNPLKNKDII